jgi:hypothetical protein
LIPNKGMVVWYWPDEKSHEAAIVNDVFSQDRDSALSLTVFPRNGFYNVGTAPYLRADNPKTGRWSYIGEDKAGGNIARETKVHANALS